MAIDTNEIRRSLLRLTRKYTDKRLEKLSEQVLDLCDAYDEATSLESIMEAGQKSIDHSFTVMEQLRSLTTRGN